MDRRKALSKEIGGYDAEMYYRTHECMRQISVAITGSQNRPFFGNLPHCNERILSSRLIFLRNDRDYKFPAF